jgi:glycosyltransferase involved in cell wall biosynthesis
MKSIGGHEIHLKSTNNLEHFPNDLKEMLVPGYHGSLSQGTTDFIDEQGNLLKIEPASPIPEIEDANIPYDLELAYTIFFQAPRRFSPLSRARGLIWNFESSILPPGWQEYHRALDYIWPSSQYSYDIFADNGIPKDKMVVIPHGVDTEMFHPDIPPFKLKTEKKIKFLHNAIPHHRKLHKRVIETYLNTFTGDDDVCLVLKTKFLTPAADKPFEIDVKEILENAYKGRKNAPEIEIINAYIPDIGSLYTACDAIVSMSPAEGFWLPGIEALACDKLVIAPRHGGQLDFLNDENSLLVDTKEMLAPLSMQYWTYHKDAVVGDPDSRHFAELMRRVYENPEEEKKRIIEPARETVKKFTWEAAAQMILDLPIPETSRCISRKRRVLYIIPYRMVGGAEVWVKEAIVRLDRNIYEPHVVFVNGCDRIARDLFENLDVTIEDLSDKGKHHALKCLMESGNYSIIHFHNSFGVYQVLRNTCKQGLRCRIVETAHSELSWHDSMTKVSARDKIITMIISVSETLGKKLIKVGNKNVAVLPQQVDWERFKVPRSKDILDEFNIPKDFVIGFVGRLSPEKNIPNIIQCARSMPDASFVIIGDGPQAGPLKHIASDLKNVFFLGRRDDVEKFYPAFDVLMLPSHMEGVPLVILEAMASGTPIVASNVGAVSEVVKEGISGFLSSSPGDYLIFVTLLNKLKDKEKWIECSKNSLIIANSIEEQGKAFDINKLYNMLFREVI